MRLDPEERLLAAVPGKKCGCHSCTRERDPFELMSRMILCPDCGNKRCPRATWHANACTGSNEPGQAGSIYS